MKKTKHITGIEHTLTFVNVDVGYGVASIKAITTSKFIIQEFSDIGDNVE